MREAVEDLLADPASPDAQTRAQRAIWAERDRRYPVPACPFTAEELKAIAVAGRRVAYLPPELAGRGGPSRLGRIFPAMNSDPVTEGMSFANDADAGGWFDYDATADPPYSDLDEPDLLAALERGQRRLLTLNQYVVAAQDTKLFTGRYLDERRSWVRLGTRVDGRLIAARFDGAEMAEGLGDEEPVDGSLLVAYDVQAGDRGPVLGARSGSLRPPLGTPDAATERARIADLYVRAGFPGALGMPAGEYTASLPLIVPAPPDYRGLFDVPLIVETRIPWREQAILLGIALSSGTRRTEYEPHDCASAPQRAPYSAWFTGWGQRFPEPIAPDAARARLRRDAEAGGSLPELIAMLAAHPEFSATGRFFEAIGAVAQDMVNPGLAGEGTHLRTPCVFHWRGRPEIGANLHPTAFSVFRPLVRGSRTNSNAS
ncbi:hypothetical protein [Amycolatopsis sp. GM8]|uniref:hypothetical protein n=1 Tax=Amycolatopsis sp. GM8 TaxID=2896530 RepID=UPI001F277617|nr:hypothetical protein [Amycolatopsis sp. GM8]